VHNRLTSFFIFPCIRSLFFSAQFA
jgi:hypothetical protein